MAGRDDDSVAADGFGVAGFVLALHSIALDVYEAGAFP
jgi:hypothetical protein